MKEDGQTRRRCHRHERGDSPWHCKECQLSFCHTGLSDTDLLPQIPYAILE